MSSSQLKASTCCIPEPFKCHPLRSNKNKNSSNCPLYSSLHSFLMTSSAACIPQPRRIKTPLPWSLLSGRQEAPFPRTEAGGRALSDGLDQGQTERRAAERGRGRAPRRRTNPCENSSWGDGAGVREPGLALSQEKADCTPRSALLCESGSLPVRRRLGAGGGGHVPGSTPPLFLQKRPASVPPLLGSCL